MLHCVGWTGGGVHYTFIGDIYLRASIWLKATLMCDDWTTSRSSELLLSENTICAIHLCVWRRAGVSMLRTQLCTRFEMALFLQGDLYIETEWVMKEGIVWMETIRAISYLELGQLG